MIIKNIRLYLSKALRKSDLLSDRVSPIGS